MVDAKDKARIEEAKAELNKYLNEDQLRNIPLLVLANKQDLGDVVTAQELKERMELDKIRNRPVHIHFVSALKGELGMNE